MEKLNRILVLALIALLTSCDAMLQMTYTVENKSKTTINLFVPNFPTDNTLGIYGTSKDTIVTVQPNQKIIVGRNTKLDFPWATKNIYKNNPGICGMKMMETDSVKIMGCTTKEWKYKSRNSNLTIK